MIADVDHSIGRWLREQLGAHVSVRFDPPSSLAAESKAEQPTLDLFLYDLREDLTGRGADWLDVRDDEGRVIARQPPLRRYDLSYLVTGWALTTELEHSLVGKVLDAAAARDVLPQEFLVGSLEKLGIPLLIQAASPQAARPASQMWADLGIAPKLGFDLLVAAPLLPAPVTTLERHAERVRLASSQNLS